MILVDSSAWIEFFRRTGSPTAVRVRHALADGFATCDPVRLEVLAGARDGKHLSELRRLLSRGQDVPVGPSQYEEAASLYRQCRRQGRTVRKMMDCLIAAAAVSVDAAVLHQDADFDALAACTVLRSA